MSEGEQIAEDGPRPSWRRAFGAVWEGVTRTSLLTVAGVVLFAAAQLAALCLLITPDRMARMNPGLMMAGPHDFDVQATVAAQRVARTAPPSTGVVLVTTSSGRHAIADEASFAEELSKLTGREVRFDLVASGRQSVWQLVQILDQLPETFSGVVLVTVGPSRFAKGREALARELRWPRLGLDSNWLRDEVTRAGLPSQWQTGVYFLDQGRFFAARRRQIVRNAILGGPTYQLHRFNFPGRASEARWEQLLPEFDRRMDQALGEEGALTRSVLERTIARVRERADVQIALVEATRHPRIVAMYGSRYPRYRQEVAEMAARADVPLWQLDAEAGITASDFYDWTHLGSQPARSRYQSVLARRTANLLAAKAQAPGA